MLKKSPVRNVPEPTANDVPLPAADRLAETVRRSLQS
jgi:hypothetical protein